MYLKYKDICIRNVEENDLNQLTAWWNDGEVMAHAGFPNGLNITKEEIKEKFKNDSDITRRRCVIEYQNKLIGETNFSLLENNIYEIGIKICDKNYQDKGLGRIILSMLIEELFLRNAKQIILDTNLNNTRAQHVYELLGFKKVRVNIDSWINQIGEKQSSVDYSLNKEDFINYK